MKLSASQTARLCEGRRHRSSRDLPAQSQERCSGAELTLLPRDRLARSDTCVSELKGAAWWRMARIGGCLAAVCAAAGAVSLASSAAAELSDSTYRDNYTGEPAAGNGVTVVFTSCGAECTHAGCPGGESVPRDFHSNRATWKPDVGQGITAVIDNNSLPSSVTSPMGGSQVTNHSQLVTAG